MNVKDIFTKALIKEQTADGSLQCGYNGNNEYLQKDTSWKNLLDGMKDEHKNQYGKGSGGELKEEKGNPPKMAAFASSSRFIYTISARDNDIPGFKFEEQLPTTVGGVANMDGYQALNGKFTFVEAKCREPYSHSIKQAIKRNYKDIYAYLREKMPRVFSCVMEDIPDAPGGKEPQNKMNVVFFCHNKVVAYFDIKQMISHLLGVATKFLDSKGALLGDVEQIQFLYLLYNPTKLAMEDEDKAEVMTVYEDTCWCAKHYHFEELFGHVVDFLAPKLAPNADKDLLQALKDSFKFDLCDQYTYLKYFE